MLGVAQVSSISALSEASTVILSSSLVNEDRSASDLMPRAKSWIAETKRVVDDIAHFIPPKGILLRWK